MKVVMFMAMSLNGYIARPDGGEDFLTHTNWSSMVALVKQAGNFIVGRKTYEANLNWSGKDTLRTLRGVTKVVVSARGAPSDTMGFRFTRSPQEALAELQSYSTVMLIGGGVLSASFAQHGMIDAVVVNLESRVIGTGRPLFAKGIYELPLKLEAVEQLSTTVVQLRYSVIH